MPIAIYDKERGTRLFEITEEQLAALRDALEEEDEHDRDYYVDAAVCDFLDGRVDAELVGRLRGLLGIAGAATAEQGESGGEGAGEGEELEQELPEQSDALGDDAPSIEIEWRRE